MSSEEVENSGLVNKALLAFRWVAALRFMGQLISWLSTIFVIRFLAPEDYGVISLSEVFRSLLMLFSTVGLTQGLMKIESLTQPVIRKTLGLLVVINGTLFVLQYSLAPYAAEFYGNSDLEGVLKVLSFTYLLIPWSTVPFALIARNLDHKKISKITFVTNVLASGLSLLLAYLGFGYWSLVASIVFAVVIECIWLNGLIDYPRIPAFRFGGAGELFKLSVFVAVAEALFVAYSRVDVLVAGKYFDLAQIGLYAVAIQLGTMLMTKSMPLFNMVAIPAFAQMNATQERSNDYLVTTIQFASTLIFPIFLGVTLVAKDLIVLIIGSTWVDASDLFAVIVVSVPLRILAYIISPAVLAAGGVRVNMTNAFFTLVFLTAAIFALLPFGLLGLAYAWSLTSLFLFILTLVRGGRVLALPIWKTCRAFLPALVVSLLMCLVVYLVDLQFAGISGIYALYKILLGSMVYILFFRFLFRLESEELMRVLWRLMGRQ
jgi:teichuronic acid exporter